jgi:hypothetical protein
MPSSITGKVTNYLMQVGVNGGKLSPEFEAMIEAIRQQSKRKGTGRATATRAGGSGTGKMTATPAGGSGRGTGKVLATGTGKATATPTGGSGGGGRTRRPRKAPEKDPPSELNLRTAMGRPTGKEIVSGFGAGALNAAGLLTSILGNAGAINSNVATSPASQLASGMYSTAGAISGAGIDDKHARELRAKTQYLASLPPSMRVALARTLDRDEVSRRYDKTALQKFIERMTR